MKLPLFLLGVAALALVEAPVLAQVRDLSVDQLSTASPVAVQQLDATQKSVEAGVASRPVQQLDRNAVRVVPPAQVTMTSSGHDPQLGQLAPRGASGTPTSQLASRGADPRLNALPRNLVDACDQAAATKRKPPAGVDCKTMVQAAPRVRTISAEETLLTDATERDAQRIIAERAARGQAPDAAEVARRLSIGDLRNAPVAQAVAQQAAADAAAQSAQQAGQGGVPGTGGAIVIQPRGN